MARQLQMTKDEEARKAINEVFADAVDEDETLNRLEALREYIEQLMDRIR